VTKPKLWYRVTEERALELKLVYKARIESTGDPEYPFRALLSWEQFWDSILVKGKQ